MDFIIQNGPDTLINSLSLNTRKWNSKTNSWENNLSIKDQKDFINKFYKRCSHSYEKPSMVDRGIQVILNSTVWTVGYNGAAYYAMKVCSDTRHCLVLQLFVFFVCRKCLSK